MQVFDNGELRDQPERAKLVMGSLMAIMLGQVDEDAAPEGLRKLPIIQAHDSVYRRMAVVLSPTAPSHELRRT